MMNVQEDKTENNLIPKDWNHWKPRLSLGANGKKNKSSDVGSIFKVTKVIRQKYFCLL